jgi:hypothetical protein
MSDFLDIPDVDASNEVIMAPDSGYPSDDFQLPSSSPLSAPAAPAIPFELPQPEIEDALA